MTTERKKEIRDKALEINNLSENFQLVHATYAVQEYIQNVVKEHYQTQLTALKRKIQEKAAKDLDISNELKEKQELEQLLKRNCFHIDIDYIDITDSNIARVVKVDNSFTIYLAKSLRDAIFIKHSHNCNLNEMNYEIIQKIRKLMAHELGHLVLHTKDLLLEESLQGTLNLKIEEQEKEDEANQFGKYLLAFRRQRNEKIKTDGGAENLY